MKLTKCVGIYFNFFSNSDNTPYWQSYIASHFHRLNKLFSNKEKVKGEGTMYP